MPRIEPFEAHAERYDAWFEHHQASYVSELEQRFHDAINLRNGRNTIRHSASGDNDKNRGTPD